MNQTFSLIEANTKEVIVTGLTYGQFDAPLAVWRAANPPIEVTLDDGTTCIPGLSTVRYHPELMAA